MVLNTSLSRFLSRLTLMFILWLIRSELNVLGLEHKNDLHCLCRWWTNYVRLHNLNIRKTIKEKISRFVIYIEAIIICCGSFINFIVVAVFINCSSSWQHHYRNHTCYNFGKKLTSNKVLVTYTLVLTNINKY